MTVDAMNAGVPVPADAAGIVGAALRKYLEGGGNDITRNLGLRAGRGGRHRSPLAAERRDQRDELILALFKAAPGRKSEKAKVAVAALAGAAIVTDADMAQFRDRLTREFSGDLPTSDRQILRIVGRASDAQ